MAVIQDFLSTVVNESTKVQNPRRNLYKCNYCIGTLICWHGNGNGGLNVCARIHSTNR